MNDPAKRGLLTYEEQNQSNMWWLKIVLVLVGLSSGYIAYSFRLTKHEMKRAMRKLFKCEKAKSS